MSRLGLGAGVVIATLIALAVPAGANTGHVFTSQTCFTWSASVTLDNNVTTIHRVEVTTTIPGTTGIVDARYDTTGNNGTIQIWSASGTAPASGTVTLTILNPDNSVDFTQSSSLQTLKDCTPTTPAPTAPAPPPTTIPISNVETSTTVAPTTTAAPTTLPEVTTTTTIEVSPTTATSPPTETTEVATTTPIVPLGSTSTSLPVGGVTTTLPRTGSGMSLPVLLGIGCLATGGLLALWRRRADWSRS